MTRPSLRAVVLASVVLACAVYLPKIAWPTSWLYVAVLSPERLAVGGGIAKLAALAVGAVYGFRVAAALGERNPARRPWQLLGAWVALWFLGEAYLVGYHFLARRLPPLPSAGDVLFVLGYVPLFTAQIRFVSVYRASGFPVGSGRQHAAIAVVAAAVVLVASYLLLAPIAVSDTPIGARFVNAGYPAADLLALVPSLVLIRIALAFRPGRVWAVWTALLTGFFCSALADLFWAYVWPTESLFFDPGMHLLWLLGYIFIAAGMKAQHELVSEPAARRSGR